MALTAFRFIRNNFSLAKVIARYPLIPRNGDFDKQKNIKDIESTLDRENESDQTWSNMALLSATQRSLSERTLATSETVRRFRFYILL